MLVYISEGSETDTRILTILPTTILFSYVACGLILHMSVWEGKNRQSKSTEICLVSVTLLKSFHNIIIYLFNKYLLNPSYVC